MKRWKKKYERPLKPYDKQRIEHEKSILTNYGLRRKHEIYRAESILRSFRRLARQLAARKDKKQEEVLLNKLHRLGLVTQNATLDEILALSLESILDRRLQSIVFKKGLAHTLRQARQFIVHGHVAIDGRRARFPSTLINVEDENKIKFYDRSRIKQTVKGETNAAKTETAA